MRVMQIAHDLAARVCVAKHYLHRRPAISFAYGLFDGDMELRGVITFGTPASRHMLVGACPTSPDAVIELNRLWCCDSMPRNTESWFVSRALASLPPRIVCSYADTERGHAGIVYRACNFFYAGWTDMERKTPRFDYVPPERTTTDLLGDVSVRPHTREAFRSGFVERVRRAPKIKYWTATGNRRDRRDLIERCAWPRLDWRSSPPPFGRAADVAKEDGKG